MHNCIIFNLVSLQLQIQQTTKEGGEIIERVKMKFKENYLDLILVPAGLFLMFTYHLYLIYRVQRYPATTVIGYENHNWMSWVEIMMQGDLNHISLALSVMGSNSTAATYLASMCLSLCTFAGMWVGSKGKAVDSVYILGDKSPATISLKDVSMLTAFVLSFGAFTQSMRCYVQANSLISMPNTDVPVTYVQTALLRGNNFWEIGLRILYFAMALLFWSFGPIPMFASCLIMVIILHFLDFNSTLLHRFRPVTKIPAKKVVEEVVAGGKEAEHIDKKVASTAKLVGRG